MHMTLIVLVLDMVLWSELDYLLCRSGKQVMIICRCLNVLETSLQDVVINILLKLLQHALASFTYLLHCIFLFISFHPTSIKLSLLINCL